MNVGMEWVEEMVVVKTKTKTKKLNYILSKVLGKFKILRPLSLLWSSKVTQESPMTSQTFLFPTPLPQNHVHLTLQVHWSRKIKTKPVPYEQTINRKENKNYFLEFNLTHKKNI